MTWPRQKSEHTVRALRAHTITTRQATRVCRSRSYFACAFSSSARRHTSSMDICWTMMRHALSATAEVQPLIWSTGPGSQPSRHAATACPCRTGHVQLVLIRLPSCGSNGQAGTPIRRRDPYKSNVSTHPSNARQHRPRRPDCCEPKNISGDERQRHIVRNRSQRVPQVAHSSQCRLCSTTDSCVRSNGGGCA